MWERREKKQIDVTRILFNERKGPGKYKANAVPIRVFPHSLALMINNSRDFFLFQKNKPGFQKQEETEEILDCQVWGRTPDLCRPCQRTTIQQ